MASYQLIQGGEQLGATLGSPGNNCSLRIDGVRGCSDVESAFQKLNPSSPRHRSRFNDSAGFSSRRTTSSDRLASLDIFRGLTVGLMILVDDVGGIIPAINHSPWNGLTLADLVMPFFLFMVGVSLGLAYKNMSSQVAASKKAIGRAVKLLILGIFLQGGYFHGLDDLSYGVDMERIRWMGILQRIAAAYLLAAICEIWLRNDVKVNTELSLLKKYQYHWIMVMLLTTMYLTLLYGLYVPDWDYQILNRGSSQIKTLTVKCGVRGDTGPACNAVGMIDRAILGIRHLYRKPIYSRTKQCSINSPDYGPLPPDAPSWCQAPFDPEGLLSTVMAIVACLVGLQFGHVIVHFKGHKERILLWVVPSFGFIVLAALCHLFGVHVNKALYSFSYMCLTTGVAGILFAAIYLVVDVYGFKRFFLVLEWMGSHALLIYILIACNILPVVLQGFYWRDPRNNIISIVLMRS